MNTKMIQSFRSVAIAAAVTLAAFGGGRTASGAVIYTYVADVSNVTLSPGQVSSISLYLVETTTGGSTSALVSEEGLFGSYVDVTYLPGVPSLASPSFISGLSPNTTDFNDPSSPESSLSPAFAYLRQITDVLAPSGPTGTEISPGVRQVYLGSVTVTGGTSGGVTTFRVGDDPAHNDTLTFDGAAPIDVTPGIVSTTFTVTIPVPEPTAAAMVWLLGCAAITRRRRV